ncbi:AAA family ATPase [Corynebacterium sanguinis]
MRSEYRSAENRESRRHPNLQVWPRTRQARSKVRSTYHHMFLSVAEAKKSLEKDDSLENRLDAQLLFPNVIRRLLEAFLAFRDPNTVGDFTGSMRNTTNQLEQSGYKGDADALRLKLTRYTHAYSHNDTPDSAAMIQPEEVRTAMAAVFLFIQSLDPVHFEGMCQVLNLKKQDLLRGA